MSTSTLDAHATPHDEPHAVPVGWRRWLLHARLTGAELKLVLRRPGQAAGVLRRAEQGGAAAGPAGAGTVPRAGPAGRRATGVGHGTGQPR